jgi:hypothetical protein
LLLSFTDIAYCHAQDMRAMTSLDVSSNLLTRGTWTNAHGNGDCNDDRNYETDMAGVIALADAIPNMRALSSLNLAENLLCGLDKYGRGVFDASGNTSPLYAHTLTHT